jgi:hypothetical protein
MNPANDYIINQPELYRSILFYLTSVIDKEIPNATLEFKYGIPYYYLNKKPFCYLAPNHKKQFVDLGFAKGFQLKSNVKHLVSENRNTVKSLRYYSLKDINISVLCSILKEATELYK